MMRNVSRVCLFSLFSVLYAFVGGCSEAGTDLIPVKDQVDIPDQFSDGSVTWHRVATMDDQDTESLSRFFAMRNDLDGSPDIAGEPLVFQSSKSDRRFYWMNATVGGSEWKCVRFEQGKFSLTEGVGSPFAQ